MFDYYKAWDKFAKKEEDGLAKNHDSDSDTEIIEAKNPIPKEQKAPLTQAEMMQRTSGAKPGTKIVIKGGSVKKSG